MIFRLAILACGFGIVVPAIAGAQVTVPNLPASATAPAPATPPPGTTYRVFLADGKVLASYGEAAQVGDRLVFNLIVRMSGNQPELQLVSLPAASVDLVRTARYAESMRAAHYSATRGETEYAAMTADMGRTLQAMAATADRRQWLDMAQQARQRLVAWSQQSFRYRERDVQEMIALFDELITQLRVAAGETSFSVELTAGLQPAAREPLLPQPTARESIAAALDAADAVDNVDERVAILRAAESAAGASAEASGMRGSVSRRLADEVRATEAYSSLANEFNRRADEAVRRGDAPAIERLRAELPARDRQLGLRRPQQVIALLQELQTKFEAASARRLALENYARAKQSLLAYERRVRPAMNGLDGLSPVLRYIRDHNAMAFERVVNAETRLQRLQADAESIVVPNDLAGVHAMLVSALRMAREACSRRRHAVITRQFETAREASSAAAGAILLAEQARQDLVKGLYPPTEP